MSITQKRSLSSARAQSESKRPKKGPEWDAKWDDIWVKPTIDKGNKYSEFFAEYLQTNVIDAHPSLSACTLDGVIGTGAYGYVFRCKIKVDKTELTCAVKIKMCIQSEDVDYYNSALKAAKEDAVIRKHLPILEGLDDWYLCEELVAPGIHHDIEGIPDGHGWLCGVIFMEELPRKITDANDIEFEVNALCELTQALCDATVFYPDLKGHNVMLRADSDIPILVDLDALLIYNKSYYNLELVASYFPFNMRHSCIPLDIFQSGSSADFECVAKYVTVVAGICTAMHVFFTVTFFKNGISNPYNLNTIVTANHYLKKQTSYENIQGLLIQVEKDSKCNTMTSSPAYEKLTTYIKNVKFFSDRFGIDNEELLTRFGVFYECRASFADLTFCNKLFQTHK
tara:strand:+ start:1836 stop:3026 length:1191 start_codon:yes stop_codon:yes gene_type:complete